MIENNWMKDRVVLITQPKLHVRPPPISDHLSKMATFFPLKSLQLESCVNQIRYKTLDCTSSTRGGCLPWVSFRTKYPD